MAAICSKELKKRGAQDVEVQAIYRKLLKGAKDPLVKEAADYWFLRRICQIKPISYYGKNKLTFFRSR